MAAKKTKDLISFSHKYSIVPAKLTILAMHDSLENLYKKAIIPYPILMQMEKPDAKTLSLVYRVDSDTEIFLFIGEDTSLSTIVHECVHIVSEIFDIMGCSHTNETEEFFAYLMDYTFEQVTIFCTEVLKMKLPIVSPRQ